MPEVHSLLPFVYRQSLMFTCGNHRSNQCHRGRLRADLVFYFKMFNNLTPFNPHEVFLIYTPIASSRSNSPYLLKPICASNKVLSTFFYRSVDAWNALPPSLRSCSSLPAFKRGLKNVDLNRYLKGSGFYRF
jgi:hypothetical protein